jgi:hypothetical protein
MCFNCPRTNAAWSVAAKNNVLFVYCPSGHPVDVHPVDMDRHNLVRNPFVLTHSHKLRFVHVQSKHSQRAVWFNSHLLDFCGAVFRPTPDCPKVASTCGIAMHFANQMPSSLRTREARGTLLTTKSPSNNPGASPPQQKAFAYN